MKKLLSLLLMLMTVFVLTVPAFADVLWTPENRFFKWHMDECEILQRSFYVNGEKGYVDLLSAPGYMDLLSGPEMRSVSGQLQNGEKVFVYWQYGNWGYVSGESEGWVALEELELIYDHISFAEEHGEEFVPYDRAVCAPLLAQWEGTTLTLWPYPGAAQADYVWKDAGSAMLEVKSREYFSQIYTDENGLTWGFCNYLWGHRNFWVCLNAPAGRDDPAVQAGEVEIPVYETPQVELTPAQEPGLPFTYGMLIVLVGALVVITGIALVALKRQKKNGN